MSVYRREDRGGWWHYRKVVQLPTGRKTRVRGKAAINTKAAAEAAERAHVERVLNPPPSIPASAELTLKDFAEERFVAECRRNWKYSERLSTKSILAVHLLPRLGSVVLAEIRGPAIEGLKTALYREGLSDKTVYNVLTLLRRILRHAQRREVLDRLPLFEMPKRVRQARREAIDLGIRREEFLSFEELEALVAQANCPRLRAMILVGGRLGLRAGEIRALEWGDIDFKAGRVTVQRADFRGVIDKPKSGAGRRVPLPKRVRDALSELPRPLRADTVVFGNGRRAFTEKEMTGLLVAAGVRAELPAALGRRKRKNDHQKAYRLRRLKRALTAPEERWLAELERRGTERFGWHTLRHTFCTHLAMTGTPVVKIQAWAGHAEISTTQRYMHWSPQADDVRHIDALDNANAKVLQLAERDPSVAPALPAPKKTASKTE